MTVYLYVIVPLSYDIIHLKWLTDQVPLEHLTVSSGLNVQVHLNKLELNYFSLRALNVFNTRVSQFELNYCNKLTFPRHLIY